MMNVKYDGQDYTFDMEECTTDQLVKIKKAYGLDVLGLAQGMQRGDIDAMRVVLWLMKVQQGSDLLPLQAVTIDKPVKFAAALMTALLKEQQALIDAAAKAEAAGEAPKE